MNYALIYSLLFLNVLNVLLHAIGVYLLISLYRTCKYRTQQLYLIHLSISEALINFLEICRTVPELIKFTGHSKVIVEEIRYYILVVSFTGISIVYYFDMIYLTFDKLMDIVLNIKYPVYWNESKTKYLLIMTWVIGLFSCVSVSICHRYFGFKWEQAFFKYFYPPIEFVFIVLALTTYAFIFRKYAQAHRKSPGIVFRRSKKLNAFQLFRRSRFYIAVLLIITFLLLFVVPDLTYLFVGILQNKKSELLSTICWICYALS